VGALGHASEAGRVCVFNQAAAGWRQTAELEGSDTVAGDGFGDVGLTGTPLLVGAMGHATEAGRSYVFTKSISGWQQTAELGGSDIVAHNGFGDPVAISGNTVAVGALGRSSQSGRVYVFQPRNAANP
jgi:hypothetical protein